MNKHANAESSTYIFIRNSIDTNGDKMTMFAGMLPDKPEHWAEIAAFKADEEITVIRLDHDGKLPSVYWAEVEMQPAQMWFPMIGRSSVTETKPEDEVVPASSNAHHGSTFDSFLEESGILQEVEKAAAQNIQNMKSFPLPKMRGASIIRCKKCNTILDSKHVHDFVQCKCDNHTFLDGGLDYQRMGGVDLSLIEVIAMP